MATAEQVSLEQPVEKGLKSGALGLVSTTIIATASVAPAYSIAATLVFVVGAVALQSPAVAVLAFVPMLLTSIGYSELNKADPDCGTSFTWASRAFGPRTGWAAGWGIIVADVLVMASLAQVAGQYGFLLFNADGIGKNATSGWVLLVGVLWIVVMTYICYRGIEVSANFQKVLLGIELVMLLVLSVTALVKVGTGHAPPGHLTPRLSWLNPFHITSFSAFASGIILMVFIYWGWDTAVAVNEETKDKNKTPGRAAILSTFILLVTYAIVIFSMQSYAGIKPTGNGLGNVANAGDVLSIQGSSIFGTSGIGTVLSHLLLLMVLSSAAASTQTTILPTARTTLSMAAYKSIPRRFAKIHPRYLTPTQSTVWMGVISGVLYLALNFYSDGGLIADAVTAIGMMIAFYYGLTGFACTWYYRHELTTSPRDFVLRGLIPTLGGLMLFSGLILTAFQDWKPDNSYVVWTTPWNWQIGWAFLLGVGSIVVGVVLMYWASKVYKPFFRGETLNRDTPIFLAEGEPISAGMTLPDSGSQEHLIVPPPD
jgi:amino acid transporter